MWCHCTVRPHLFYCNPAPHRPLVPPQHLSYLRAGPFPIFNRPLVEPLHCRFFQIFHFICSTQSILSARSFRDLNSQRESSVERREEVVGGERRGARHQSRERDGWPAGDRRPFDIKILAPSVTPALASSLTASQFNLITKGWAWPLYARWHGSNDGCQALIVKSFFPENYLEKIEMINISI